MSQHNKKPRAPEAPPVPHSNVALVAQDRLNEDGSVSRQLTPFRWPVNRATRRGRKVGTRGGELKGANTVWQGGSGK